MIGVGIKRGSTTTWYRVHSLARRPDGAMCLFGLDEKRTTYTLPARMFAGVAPSGECSFGGEPYPDLTSQSQLEAGK